MADQHSHDHHPAATHTDADRTGFRADDYNAGKAVVAIVLSIFCMGVGIYSIVAYTVINWN